MATPVRIRKPLGYGGLDKSLPGDEIEPTKAPDLLNVRVRFGTIRSTPGRQVLAGASTGEDVIHIGRFSLVDGTEWTFMFIQTILYRWGETVPGIPRQWHKVPGPSITGTRRFGVTSGEGFLFFSRKESGTGIYKWPGGAGAQALIVPSAGTVPPAKFVEYYNDRLIAANIIDSGIDRTNRIRWPVNANHLDWSGTGSGFLDLYSGVEEPITGFLSLNDRVVVYRKHTITDFIATGQLTPVFVTQLRVNGTGCSYPYTIASNGQKHFFLGNDRTVWSWDGSTLTDIGQRVKPELEALVDYAKADEYFGVVTPDRGEYWLVLTTGDVFVYDYRTDSWWRDSFPNITALGEVIDTVAGGAIWSGMTRTWGQETRTWDAMGDAGTIVPSIFAGRGDGATFTVDEAIGYDYYALGSIMERYIQTEDYFFPSKRITEGDPLASGTIQRLALLYTWLGNTEPFEVAASFDRGVTWETRLVTPNESGISYVDFNATGSFVRFRFRETNNTFFRWKHYVLEFVPTGDTVP